ncbi:MAG: PIG-L family deacetylase [Chloroflexi bacterium]|nr:MAG: PIG-L family deacetylase [Chloroflexota bacterium]
MTAAPASAATSNKLRILVIGAHPDDCEYLAGGVTALYTRLGHQVKLVSLTNGSAGGRELSGAALARVRSAEAHAAAKALGAESLVLDIDDGTLMPTYENRLEVIKIIREFQPDLVMTHRTNDYHPDHRYTGLLVQDAINMVIVGPLAPLTPRLSYIPVMVYLWDDFQKPYPFIPDIVVDVDEVYEQKLDGLEAHESQVYDLIFGKPDVPEEKRRAWLKEQLEPEMAAPGIAHREKILQVYGKEKGEKIHYIEAFEVAEYGSKLTPEKRKRIFPFLPG